MLFVCWSEMKSTDALSSLKLLSQPSLVWLFCGTPNHPRAKPSPTSWSFRNFCCGCETLTSHVFAAWKQQKGERKLWDENQRYLKLTWWQWGLDSLPYEYELLSVLPARGCREKEAVIREYCLIDSYQSMNNYLITTDETQCTKIQTQIGWCVMNVQELSLSG